MKNPDVPPIFSDLTQHNYMTMMVLNSFLVIFGSHPVRSRFQQSFETYYFSKKKKKSGSESFTRWLAPGGRGLTPWTP